jgi:RNA polymerase sigma-70 factor, ECF subfamily
LRPVAAGNVRVRIAAVAALFCQDRMNSGSMLRAHDVTQDAQLLMDVGDGSLDGLGELYRRHSRAVYAVALRLLGSREEAEDVLQDVFVGLPRALRSYREQGRFEAWLKRLAVRTALMRLRSRRRRREDAFDAAPERGTPEMNTVDRIAAERAIAALPDNLRVVFVLREVEGYTHTEIAGMLGISAINSATRLSRAWTMLRKGTK